MRILLFVVVNTNVMMTIRWRWRGGKCIIIFVTVGVGDSKGTVIENVQRRIHNVSSFTREREDQMTMTTRVKRRVCDGRRRQRRWEEENWKHAQVGGKLLYYCNHNNNRAKYIAAYSKVNAAAMVDIVGKEIAYNDTHYTLHCTGECVQSCCCCCI